jgi:ATP-dependent helicase HepA
LAFVIIRAFISVQKSIKYYMTPDFAVGQRWLSENEPELGLGMVEDVERRTVGIYFPGCDERRSYAKSNAPLSRMLLDPGQKLETIYGDTLLIDSVEELNQIAVYLCVDAQGTKAPVPETQLTHKLELTKASDRLFSGQLDSLKWFDLRFNAIQAKQQQQRSNVFGLQGARCELIGHQLFIANEVGQRHAPRVMLADEVGLGKTIEAGLIIHQQLLNEQAKRVLITVPQALVHQWFVEMIRRFNLHFSIFDESRIQALAAENKGYDEAGSDSNDSEALEDSSELGEDKAPQEQNTNPFMSEQLILCSHEFLEKSDLAPLLEAEWDLFVVDEAHHIEWQQQKPSELFGKVSALSSAAPGLLLLSATPEQLGIHSHFARLQLLDPQRFHCFDTFMREQEDFKPIAQLIEQLVDSEIWSDELKQAVSQYIEGEAIDESRRDQIVRELLDRNGTGRVFFRNTRNNIKGFPKRQLNAYPLENCSQYIDLCKVYESSGTEHLLNPETLYLDDSWITFDQRVAWLKSFIFDNEDEKILVICAQQSTAMALDYYFKMKCGVRCSAFHEELDIIGRDRAAAYFADQEDGAQVLFCSEIGSEGRNFQFSRHLVLFDLPLNPDLLEQRIGRLDRIGQKRTIQIHVPYLEQSAQAVLLDWYHQGMQAFEHCSGIGSMVYKQFSALVNDAIHSPDDQELLQQLIDESAQYNQQVQQKMLEGRNRLLELASFDEHKAAALIDDITMRDEDSPKRFIEQCWDRFGVRSDHHSAGMTIIEPGEHMFVGGFPGLMEDGQTVTFQRSIALARDDVHFLSWEHPMVTGALDLALTMEKGNASVCMIENKGVQAGTLLMEVLFTLDPTAPRSLQAHRYLPYQGMRVLLDMNGNNLAEKVSYYQFDKQCKKLERNLARQVVKSEEQKLKVMLEKAQALANTRSEATVAQALEVMRDRQQQELQRMTALAKTNPNIRQEEIRFIKGQTKALEACISEAVFQVAAIKVIIAA